MADTVITLAVLAAIGGAIWFSHYRRRDRAVVRLHARIWAWPDGIAPIAIEIRNFGPRTARIERIVIDSDVIIAGKADLGSFESNQLWLVPFTLKEHQVTFIDATIHPYTNAKRLWVYGTIVETGAPWNANVACTDSR